MSLIERFIKYTTFDTQSDPGSEKTPSSDKQLILAKYLEEELKNLGLKNIILDENGYLYAKLPSNCSKNLPKIGFISHMDTSPDMTGKNVKAKIWENYDGRQLLLNKEKSIILSPGDFPELNNYIGKTIITTDGTTLLGADDKAGIAEIITAMEHLVNNQNIEHGDISLAFTPDEEIGRGADKFNLELFDAEFAYTIDGGELGGLEYESFNAAQAKIKIKGRNVHPGEAKNKMINSLQVAMELHHLLPENQRPEYTEGYEGFYHLTNMDGTVEECNLQYIIRDHDKDQFLNKKNFLINSINFLNEKYKSNIIELAIKDQYYNMKEKISPLFHIVEAAEKAIIATGIKSKVSPIRGGTDGSKLSFMGLPTPNIFTGGHNYHGKFEYIVLESMEKTVEVIINIIKNIK